MRQTSSNIMGQVSESYAGKTGGSANSFSYELTSSKFELKANGNVVFKATSSGIETIRIEGTSMSLGSISAAEGSFSLLNVDNKRVYPRSINNDSQSFYAFTGLLTAKYSAAAGGYVLDVNPRYYMQYTTINTANIPGTTGNSRVLTI